MQKQMILNNLNDYQTQLKKLMSSRQTSCRIQYQ